MCCVKERPAVGFVADTVVAHRISRGDSLPNTVNTALTEVKSKPEVFICPGMYQG